MRKEVLVKNIHRTSLMMLVFCFTGVFANQTKEKFSDLLVDQVVKETPEKSDATRNPAIIWSGPTVINSDVVDCDLYIDGTIDIEDQVRVQACSTDITVTISDDAIIQADGNGNSRISFDAAFGQTITICMDFDLAFRGAANGENLLLLFRGPGTIAFQIEDDRKLLLTQNNIPDGGSVHAYLLMIDPIFDENGENVPTLCIGRKNQDSSNDVDICIGEQSFLTYAACNCVAIGDATEKGCIKFNAGNEGTGKMNFTIADTGGFIIAGHRVDNFGQCSETEDPCQFGGVPIPLISSFDRRIPAGMEAIFKAANEFGGCPRVMHTTGALLQVKNQNNTEFNLLFDPWCNLKTREQQVDNDCDDNTGCFDGIRYGFVVGANGTLAIQDRVCFDYIGLGCNSCSDPSVSQQCEEEVFPNEEECPEPLDNTPLRSKIKPRNWSALIVDGYNNQFARNAKMVFGNCSALFFRSGVNRCCIQENFADTDFAIDPSKATPGTGEFVFAVEGPLDVCGFRPVDLGECELPDGPCGVTPGDWRSKIEILSLTSDIGGGPLLISNTCCASQKFYKRNFNTFDGEYLRYNTAAFLINNDVNLHDIALVHSDENHNVIEKNDSRSEPTYVGGDTAVLKGLPKPRIAFYNSALFVHTDIAFTGLDLLVTNGPGAESDTCLSEEQVAGVCEDNVSRFIFFHNGKAIDQGFGRQFILGTQIGSLACDDCTVICRDAHLDVFQLELCTDGGTDSLHQLLLQTEPNNECITEGLTGNVTNEFSIHTIFLGHNSNISVGRQEVIPPQLRVNSHLIIDGNIFSFEARGGRLAAPELSGLTGTGGIFVDTGGTFCIRPYARANMSTMVVKSGEGVINLPKGQVFFDTRLGIENWRLDLTDPNQRVLAEAGDCLSNVTLNWLAATKDYNNFCPYAIGCFNPCACPEVTEQNIASLPTVEGIIEQLQIRGSRLGDEAHLVIDRGHVKELVHFVGHHSAEAPTSVIVLANNGRVGLGSTHKDADSTCSSVALGINGVTIIANGSGRVDLNEDLVIDNICHILKGPNFFEGSVLKFHSDCCRTIRVKSTGALDLSSFENPNEIVEFAGNIKLILEPGAKIIWGGRGESIPGQVCESFIQTEGGTLRLVDNACILCESNDQFGEQFGGSPSVNLTDATRVKFVGKGYLDLGGCSCLIIDKNAHLGIETILPEAGPADQCGSQSTCEIVDTDIRITLTDKARFTVGNDCDPEGGSFQVGNTSQHSYSCINDNRQATINFTLRINGQEACFKMGERAFVGLAVGIADKGSLDPDNWSVDTLWNVQRIQIFVESGKFSHSRIYTGSNSRASLLAFSDGEEANTLYDFSCIPNVNTDDLNISETSVLGGGNIAYIAGGAGPLNPVVGSVDVTTGSLRVSILASKGLMNPTFGAFSGSAENLFTALKTNDTTDVVNNPQAGRTNVAKSHIHNNALIGYVEEATIQRATRRFIRGEGGQRNIFEHTFDIGAAQLLLGLEAVAPRSIVDVRQLP